MKYNTHIIMRCLHFFKRLLFCASVIDLCVLFFKTKMPYNENTNRKSCLTRIYMLPMQLLLGYPREGDKHPTLKSRKEGRIIRIEGKNE